LPVEETQVVAADLMEPRGCHGLTMRQLWVNSVIAY